MTIDQEFADHVSTLCETLLRILVKHGEPVSFAISDASVAESWSGVEDSGRIIRLIADHYKFYTRRDRDMVLVLRLPEP